MKPMPFHVTTFRNCSILAALLASGLIHAQDKTLVRFFGSSDHPITAGVLSDPAIPSPEKTLGFEIGERPARQAQVLEYLRALDAATDRVKLFDMGSTYEGRPLVYAVISDEANMVRLEEIKNAMDKIADPRVISRTESRTLTDATPAVVWLAYSIHGDEISGVDASLAVAYHLAAGRDSLSARLRKELVTIIDPMENPDGRERFLAQMESFASAVPHADGQSLQRGGFWPWGRGNHYLFDMNRDWFTQELTESKARISAIMDWKPQVFVDAHEMGQWDTYLFSPPRHPFNPHLTDRIKEWWEIFAGDQSKAFDKRGWAYYTRDWNEEWYPGYGSSWPLYTGAIGILYEQAGVSGSRISRHDGTVLTYSESVEHHYVSSLTNLETAARHRKTLLSDYYEHRSAAIATHGGGKARAFLVAPDRNSDRWNHLAETLTRQGIEVRVSGKPFTTNARGYYSTGSSTKQFPAGTMIIPTGQPQGFLVQAILGFDPHLSDSFLVEERRELLKHQSSKLYEITSWSMLQAYGLDAYETESEVSADSKPWTPIPVKGAVVGSNPQQGFVMEAENDRAARAIAMMFDRKLTLYAARKDIDWEEKRFRRGSIFLPRRSNPGNYQSILDTVAAATGATFIGINSGRGDIGPDLGSSELEVLVRPRVALAAGGATSFTSVGWTWHMLDQKSGLPVSLIDLAQLGNADLSVYNALILPTGGDYSGVMGRPTVEKIRNWVSSGGTLIAMGNAAEFCADSTAGFSSVRPRHQVLSKLNEYATSAGEEMSAEKPDVRKLQIWAFSAKDSVQKGKEEKTGKKEPETATPEQAKKVDQLARVMSPHGAILRVNLDQEEWLTFGLDDRLPVMMTNSTVLMAKYPPTRTVARFARQEEIRVSGLLWPEARARLANTAYCTRDRLGKGQVILFSDQPNFRAFFRGSERLLLNAILYGPGLGTNRTPEW